MSNLTPAESSAIQIVGMNRRRHNAEALYKLSLQFAWAKHLFKAAYCYEVHVGKIWMVDHYSEAEYLQEVGIHPKTVERYSKIAERMREMIERENPTPEGEEFAFTERSIKRTFGKFFERAGGVTAHKLRAASNDLQQFENLLEGAQLPNAELTRMLEPLNSERSPMLAGPAPDRAPSMHERIISAGYLHDKKYGRYLDPATNEPITVEQLAEFVDDEMGTVILRETKKLMEKAKEELADYRRRYLVFWEAYQLRRSSPEFERTISEMEKEVATLAQRVAFDASVILSLED